INDTSCSCWETNLKSFYTIMDEFLDQFVIATNQEPHFQEAIRKIINNQITKKLEMKKFDDELIMTNFCHKINKWIQSKDGKHLSNNDFDQIINDSLFINTLFPFNASYLLKIKGKYIKFEEAFFKILPENLKQFIDPVSEDTHFTLCTSH